MHYFSDAEMNNRNMEQLKQLLYGAKGKNRWDYKGIPEMFLYKRMPLDHMSPEGRTRPVFNVRIPLFAAVETPETGKCLFAWQLHI